MCGWLTCCLSLFGLLEHKYHRLGGLNNKHLFLTLFQAGKSKAKVLACAWWGSAFWFIEDHLLLCPQMARGALRFLLQDHYSNSWGCCPCDLIIARCSPLQIPSQWGLGFQHKNWRAANIQFVTPTNQFRPCQRLDCACPGVSGEWVRERVWACVCVSQCLAGPGLSILLSPFILFTSLVWPSQPHPLEWTFKNS